MINVQNIFIHFSNKSKLNIRISRIRWKVWTYAAFVRSFRSSCKYTTFYGLIYASTSTWFVYRLTILLSIFFFSPLHFELCHVNIVTNRGTERNSRWATNHWILLWLFPRIFFWIFLSFSFESRNLAFFCNLLLKLKIKLFGISILILH